MSLPSGSVAAVRGVNLVHIGVWIGGACEVVSVVTNSGSDMNARTQGLPAEHCIVSSYSELFTSAVCGINVVAEFGQH